MRILLLGEFSSLHKYLYDGLKKIGNADIDFITDGGGWQETPGWTGKYPRREKTGIIEFAKYNYNFVRWGNSLGEYDIIQFINAGMFPTLVSKILVKILRSKGKVLSLLCAGDDYEQVKVYKRHTFKYYVYDYDKFPLEQYDTRKIKGYIRVSNEQYLANQVDIIIPTVYSYSLGYEGKNMFNIIPFPINLDELEYRPNISKQKIVFFHGINRELAKGTPFIREALNRLVEKYSHDVEVIINKRMPYIQYVKAIQKANVIVDQCCGGNGNGMNALISMAQGKVVMAGNNPNEKSGIDCDFCPVVHIEPNVDQIYSQLVFILENRNTIEQWGAEGRKYVETYHECKMIAQRYIDAWKSTGKLQAG